MRLGSIEVASRYQMGLTNLHHTKDSTVRVVSNFREINTMIARKPFPIPKVSTVLQELDGFTYAAALVLTWAITPLDWIQMLPKYVPLPYHGESTLTSGYQ